MNTGFIKVAAAAPEIRVGDCDFNRARILENVETARRLGVQMLVLPELCVTGATCGDLFAHGSLLRAAERSLSAIAEKTAQTQMLILLGLPVECGGTVFNCAAVLHGGQILGLIAKTCPGVRESSRVFGQCPREIRAVNICGQAAPLGQGLIFRNSRSPGMAVGVEIGGDSRLSLPPSLLLCAAGAGIIAGLTATPENALQTETPARALSRQGMCAYIEAGAGVYESTTDFAFGGGCGVYECGEVLDSAAPFEGGMAVGEVDLSRIAFERAGLAQSAARGGHEIYFDMEIANVPPTRVFDPAPFIPKPPDGWKRVLAIQSAGLARRLAHTGAKTAVIGISGGLDSALALIVAVKAFEMLGREKSEITAVTMPCFGTSDETLKNAQKLCAALGVPLEKIDITPAVKQHFKDISHTGAHDAAYENAQARERTQVLMDIANMRGGFVVGTGDMSELALGWATYNGDHMSMYGVNCGVSKTLARHVLSRFAAGCGNAALRGCVEAIVETPVSPELLPVKDGKMAQITEDLVGPYELHDFFLYYMLGRGFSPQKLHMAACSAFSGKYEPGEVKKWLEVFIRRFFSQQYKRSCAPDGPSVCGISLSPRCGLVLPSDASADIWLGEIEEF